MITLTFSQFLIIYLLLFLAGIIALWVGYEMVHHYSSHLEKRPILCRICGAKLAPSQHQLLSCSSCGSNTERNYQGGL